MRPCNRGMSLGTVLLVLAMLATALFGLAAVGLSQYQLSLAQFNRNAASRAARSIVARGLVELRRNPQWGADGKASLEMTYAQNRGAVGSLTFSSASGKYSSNNLQAAQGTGWEGAAVPAEFVRLVGVGRCRGQEQIVEAWYHLPTYPWAIASGGPVALRGGARIAGLKTLPAPGEAPDTGQMTPADLRCNGDEVFLGKGTQVLGDVITSGSVVAEPGTNLTVGPVAPLTAPEDSVWVHGKVRTGEGEPPIAAVGLDRFDPANPSQALPHSNLAQNEYDDVYHVNDMRRRQGNVNFTQGLAMDGGLLFVDGDLTVRGGMTGSGLVVCTGRVTVEGASSLSSGSGVALVAGGQVSLTGSGSAGSYFQGLVYTDTGFSADRVSLVGALVSRGDAPVELTQAQLLLPEGLPQQWSAGGGAGAAGPDPATTVTVYRDLNGPVSDSSWLQAWVYQKHERMPGDPSTVYYEGTRFDRLPDGSVNPIPAQRRETTDLDQWVRLGTLDGGAAGELKTRPVTPEAGDPPAPPSDPKAASVPGVTLDANQFFRLQDRLHQLLWVER